MIISLCELDRLYRFRGGALKKTLEEGNELSAVWRERSRCEHLLPGWLRVLMFFVGLCPSKKPVYKL